MIGAICELHSSGGYDVSRGNREASSVNTYRLLVAGPEFGYVSRNVELKAYYKTVLNSTAGTLTELGDVMDRGAGGKMVGTSLTMNF